jgi:hypothetical protein
MKNLNAEEVFALVRREFAEVHSTQETVGAPLLADFARSGSFET